jgi:hypothetical protein
MKDGRAILIACILLVRTAAPAMAQTVNGTADWGYGRSTYRTGDEDTSNGSFTQAYTVGYNSVLWDPRFLTYSGELTFYRNALTFGNQDGKLRQTGYKLATSLFPARPFPLSIQASRTIGNETANYPTSSPLRGGLALPGDAVALRTRQSLFGVNWRLDQTRLPRVDLGYLSTSAELGAGALEGNQRQTNIQALVAHDTPRLRNALRYDRNAFDSALSQAFRQRHSDLNYELIATVSPRTSGTVRVGRRSTFSLFDAPPQFTEVGTTFLPPSTGEVGLHYAVATFTHQPVSRVMTDMSVSYDRQRSADASVATLLGVATARYNVLRGLTLNGTATYGQRDQQLAQRIKVLTRGLGAGATYDFALRFVQAGAGYDVARGRSTGELGAEGRNRSWRGRAHVSGGIPRWVELGVGYEQNRSHDDLLVVGNQWQERLRTTARSSPSRRLLLEASWEKATIERGLDAAGAGRSRYLQTSGAAAVELARDRRLTFTAGRFDNRSFTGDDSTKYVGLSLDAVVAGGLRLAITARREDAFSDLSQLDQAGYYTTAIAEYRLRLFTFSLEHRYTDLALSSTRQTDPITFYGNQVLFRVGRRFWFVP